MNQSFSISACKGSDNFLKGLSYVYFLFSNMFKSHAVLSEMFKYVPIFPQKMLRCEKTGDPDFTFPSFLRQIGYNQDKV